MQFQSACVSQLDGVGQRIVKRHWRSPHHPAEIFRPRLIGTRIERITHGPHLKNHGIETKRLSQVEDGAQLGLLLLRGEAARRRKVYVFDRGHPDAPELTGNARNVPVQRFRRVNPPFQTVQYRSRHTSPDRTQDPTATERKMLKKLTASHDAFTAHIEPGHGRR